MEISEYKNIYEREGSHFFYTGNHNVILSLVRNYTQTKRNLKILDAGCGTGLLAKKLEKYGDVIGLDSSPHALRFAKKRGVKVKKGSINKMSFKNNLFDLIVSVDVIYHKDVDDKKAFAEFFRVLKPEGLLIIRTPALPWLMSTHDTLVHTRERYTKNDLSKKLTKAGFLVKKLSFVNIVLFPLRLFKHFADKINPMSEGKSEIFHLHPILNKTLSTMLAFEAHLLKSVNLPIGLGLIAVCQKPNQ